MAAKSKKRLSKVENKLLKLENLQLQDVICPICQTILVQPVTLPCYHSFCLSCFNGSIENNALCCPLCRLRIGSWLRTSTKQRGILNVELWDHIQTNFSHEVEARSKGEDISLPEEKPRLRLSAPGEIRLEYEVELERLRNERLQLEKKQIEETELLVKKLQEEEEEAHRKYLEAIKRDEIVALEMQRNSLKHNVPHANSPCMLSKPRLKNTKIDSYLSKHKVATGKDLSTKDVDSIPKAPTSRQVDETTSPEMIPSYKLMKSLVDKKKLIPGVWNKENGDKMKEKFWCCGLFTNISRRSGRSIVANDDPKAKEDNSNDTEEKVKTKNGVPSLLVSLPLPYSGILQQKVNLADNRKETGSVDSMREELCFFKPILVSRPSSTYKELPVRVPGIRATPTATSATSPSYSRPPTRIQYLDSLCRLRNLSLAKKLPSAFVIALNELKEIQVTPDKCSTRITPKVKQTTSCNVTTPVKKKTQKVPDDVKSKSTQPNLGRTRSMGTVSKNENETTPKKAKINRKAISDRKPYLRSDSKKSVENKVSPIDTTNNNKINLAVKNLTSPLKNCEVKHILHEQLRIEKIIEQEKSDLEFARQLEAELNVPRTRRAVKRQVSLTHALRPVKKLKV